MATSTFYDKIVIEKEAAQILVDGLKGPKHPRPVVQKECPERREALLKQFLTNSKKSLQTQTVN